MATADKPTLNKLVTADHRDVDVVGGYPTDDPFAQTPGMVDEQAAARARTSPDFGPAGELGGTRRKTRHEIEAEKDAKPRPDLVPAAVATLFRDVCASDPNTGNDYAIDSMLRFAATGDVSEIIEAMAALVFPIGDQHEDAIEDTIDFALMVGGRVMGYGFRKHGICTWRIAGTGQADPQTHYASALRHLLEYGIDNAAREEGSGYPVLWHAFAQLAILADLVMDPPMVEGTNDDHWRCDCHVPHTRVRTIAEVDASRNTGPATK